jgi:hypothetical protein
MQHALLVVFFSGSTLWGQRIMDNEARSFDAEESWAFSPHLPAIIPRTLPSVAVPDGRFALPPSWRLIAVAVLASGVGFETAILWPSQDKLAAVLQPSPSGHDAASTASESAALPFTAPRSPSSGAAAVTAPSSDAPAVTAPSPGAAAIGAPSSHAPAVVAPSTGAAAVTAPSSDATAVAPPISTSTATGAIVIPSVGTVSDACRASFPAPQLVVGGPPNMRPADASASLGVTVYRAPDGAQLVICGFAAKSIISAGRSIDEETWIIPITDAADAVLIPPLGFVGSMKLVVALVSADGSLTDRRTVHLQWTHQTPMPAAARREVNEQLEEGKRLEAVGNLTAARSIFQQLAQNGHPRAAFLLAETYDPISLAKHQLPPPDSDLEKARLWYRRAGDKGSLEANARLERLANW